MFNLLFVLLLTFFSVFKNRRDLGLEVLALRQQLAVYKRQQPRPQLKHTDRLFWVWLSKIWSGWRQSLIIVRPETVVGWHRKGFKLFWSRISQRKSVGRPAVSPEVRALIKRIAAANPLWGAPRMHGELLKLGIEISERTVSRLMPKRRNPPSQSWRTFLDNHFNELVSIDFFTVPTATFRVLFVFVVLAHDRRRVIHFNITEHPSACWTAQQMVEAFPEDSAPRYLIRDRDQIYGEDFRQRVQAMSIEEVITALQSPWQNAYVERLIGSIRRECLDHVIVLGESHLRRILRNYFEYYHQTRTHLSLAKDAPEVRSVHPSEAGEIIALPQVGGLHHRYERRAA
ncbi:MAG: DDE-type integrase/transposase/recombinase [Pyrinomonadaceae bacterium]|nr:DDE-type integrase/transposase/recombinase [Pyrinomonadaceae bacterium]